MARHDDLVHSEIAKAYEAFGSDRTEAPSGADRIIIVLDLVLHRMAEMSSNGNGFRNRVKRQGPPVLSGLGLGAFLLKVLEVLV